MRVYTYRQVLRHCPERIVSGIFIFRLIFAADRSIIIIVRDRNSVGYMKPTHEREQIALFIFCVITLDYLCR